MELHRLDSEAFGRAVEPYRRELQVHCYRMLGSVEDAEDMVQETFMRAWNRRDSLREQSALRAWLYKIATNICLDTLKKQSRRMIPRTRQAVSSVDEPIPADVKDPVWLQPYPDDLLPPDVKVSRSETITLAFIAVLHLLPPRQRAILILRDVLDWKAREVASLMDTSVSAVKSALFRARMTLADNQDVLTEGDTGLELDDSLQAKLDEYVTAWESANIEAFIATLKEDAIFSMPPIPSWYRGRDEIRALVAKTVFSGEAKGRWRLYPVLANRQPASGLYRLNEKEQHYQFYGIQVLRFKDGFISDSLTFRHFTLYRYFDLPATLPLKQAD